MEMLEVAAMARDDIPYTSLVFPGGSTIRAEDADDGEIFYTGFSIPSPILEASL